MTLFARQRKGDAPRDCSSFGFGPGRSQAQSHRASVPVSKLLLGDVPPLALSLTRRSLRPPDWTAADDRLSGFCAGTRADSGQAGPTQCSYHGERPWPQPQYLAPTGIRIALITQRSRVQIPPPLPNFASSYDDGRPTAAARLFFQPNYALDRGGTISKNCRTERKPRVSSCAMWSLALTGKHTEEPQGPPIKSHALSGFCAGS